MVALTIADMNSGKQDLDHVAAFATSPAMMVTDRLGRSKRSLAGVNAAADLLLGNVRDSASAALASLGYEPAVQYAAGISLVRPVQSVEYQGIAYAPKLNALPFVTSGAFEADKFKLIQGVVASDLAGPAGSARVGMRQRGAGAVLRTAADKLSELISPRDYGAAVDGIANDSDAVAVAAAIGEEEMMPVVIPKRAKNNVSLAGTERFVTRYSEPWETDFIARYMNNAYAGLAVKIDGFGDSTYWGADTANLSAQAPESPLARLEIILRRFYSNNNISVRNRAISGTTVLQMLTGTDGSGQTFEERIAASDADIVYVNHCINSCQLSEPADGYKRDMHLVAEIIRKHGKTPVFSTPNPMLPTMIGDRRKAEQLKAYAEAMRQVCREAGIPLADNYAWITKIIGTGRYKVLDVLPDGCHPSNFFYTVIGQNLAIPLICPGLGFTQADQFLSGMSSQVLGTAGAALVSSNSRLGGAVVTGGEGAQSIRIAFVVEEAGLDIYLAHPVWPAGAANASISVDRSVFAAGFSFYDEGRNQGRFIQDHETRVMRNALPGMHFIELESGAGGLGVYYLRTRPTQQEKLMTYGVAFNYRQRLLSNFEVYSSAANAMVLLDDIPTPRLDKEFRIEVSTTWQAGTGIVLNGLYTADNAGGTPQIEAGYIVGLDLDGFACIWENQGGNYAKLLQGTVSYAGTLKTFYIRSTGGRFGVIDLYIDSSLVGSVHLTRPYWGGLLGFWKEASVGGFRVDRVDFLNDGA